jgi:hypothetical protein
MAAGSLEDAANVCVSTMNTRYIAGTLKANMIAFCNALTVAPNNLFPDDNPALRPIGDWFILLQMLASQMSNIAPPNQSDVTRVQDAIMVVYRLCWQCEDFHNAAQPPQITNTQYNAVLAAFNANLD